MENQTAPIGAASNVVKLPYSVTRRAYTRRPRPLKNGSPEEGAILAAAAERARGHVLRLADAAATDQASTAMTTEQFREAIEELSPADRQVLSDKMIAALSETGRNEQLRRKRRDVWQAAEAKVAYWEAWSRLHSAIERTQRCDVLDGLGCPAVLRRMHDSDEPWILDNEIRQRIRAAEIEMLLTPAPTVAALKFKKAKLLHPWYRRDADADAEYLRKHFKLPLSPFRDIEQAIADDEAWLEAHPARQCKANARRRRAE